MPTRLACDRDELDQLAGTYETMVLEHDEYFKQILEMSLQTEKLKYQAFLEVGSNRHFSRFWREMREDRREKPEDGHTPQDRTSNRRKSFLRCYKWMYSLLTGTAFPR